MKKSRLKIIICFLTVGVFISCYLFYVLDKTKDINILENESIQISNKLKQNYKDDLIYKNEIIQSIMKKTNSNSLSKDDILAIYKQFDDKNICISDSQSNYNLYGKENFLDFWRNYQSKKNAQLTHYTISITGELNRDDFIYQNKTLFLMTTRLYYDNQKAIITDTDSWIIEKAEYDSYGYFSYKKKILEKNFDLSNITYDYFRVVPMDDKLRAYTKTYIEPIEYDCNNLFVMDWNEQNIDKISFNDLVEYLFALNYKEEIFQSRLRVSEEPYISYIDADFFEDLIHHFFEIDQSLLRQNNYYCSQEHAYPYSELYCIASHTEPPKLRPEVVKAEQKENILELTVHAMGYEKGFPLAFTHIVSIRLLDNGTFHYLSNKIIPNDENQIPKYSPGINNKSPILNKSGCS